MSLYDFLTFRTMITPALLLGVYYFGAFVMPLAVYGGVRFYLRRYGGAVKPQENSPSRWSWKLRLLFLLFFFMGEVAWRIFIEFFVAYFQIRDALIG